MKKLYVFGSLLAAALILQAGVSAEGLKIEPQGSDGAYKISGKAEKNAQVLLQIFVKDGEKWNKKPLETAIENSVNKYVGFTDQTGAGENGEFTFDLSVAGLSENYEAYVYSGGKQIGSGEFNFSNNEEFKEKVGELTDIAQGSDTDEKKISDVVVYIETNKKALGLSFELYENMNAAAKKNLAELLFNTGLKGGKLKAETGSDIEKAKLTFRNLSAVAALNGSQTQNIFDYKEELDFKSSDIKDWYNKEIVKETMQRFVTARISGKGFKTEKEYNDALKEALILEVVKEPDGWGNVKAIMEDFSDFIGIDTSIGTQGRYQSLVKKQFADKAALKTAYTDYKEPSEGGNGGGNGGGGGRGNGGSGGFKADSSISKVTPPSPISTTDMTKQPVQFSDLGDVEWARDAIKDLAEKGIVSGKDAEHFAPNDNITREETAKIIAEIFKLSGSGSVPFGDVTSDDWFYPYVSAVYNNKIVNGISENMFGSGLPVTRQDMCTMIYNAVSASGTELDKKFAQKTFEDNDVISPYAAEAVAVLQTAGIISGDENNEFKPQDGATRAEAAVVLQRLLAYVSVSETENMSN